MSEVDTEGAIARITAERACEVCGGPMPCEGCAKYHQTPGTSRTDHSLDVVLPVDQDGEDRVRLMLRERGYDPDEWEIRSITVNEWEAQRPKDRGLRILRQTKAHLTKIIPIEDTPWGRFLEAIKIEPEAWVPRKELKPKKGNLPTVTVLIGDDQAPWVNWSAHEATCEALADIRPDRIIYMGDGYDFDSISRYPLEHPEWESTLNETLKAGYRVIRERMEAAGWPSTTFLEGNHEHRLQKFLLQKAPQLFGLKAAHMEEDDPSVLSLRFVGGLDSLGINYATSPVGAYPHPNTEVAPGYIATHGWIARKKAGASALASVETLNSSIAVGHTHRLAIGHITRWTGEGPVTYTTAETGTMADLRGLGYAKNPDWQTGWLTVTSWPDGTHMTDMARMEGSVLTWRDRRWEITPRGVRR